MTSIRSMTAFARESGSTERGVLTVELRTVNHRYLDCNFKLPDDLRALEPQLREQLASKLTRGKVDCLVRLQATATQASGFNVNSEALAQLAAAADLVAGEFKLRKPSALEVLQYPGICHAPDSDEETLQQAASQLFGKTLDSLLRFREREGEKLAALVVERLALVDAEVATTRAALPALRQHQHQRLQQRIAELGVEVDQGRLEQELVYLAQKADVDEELDRLTTHCEEVRRALKKGSPCGRRLDFLMQELNREANTLSSKSNSSGTTQSAVELKVLIEQMREQIQNIE
ncbi:YicC/YloC family endoribonuclease [Haliea sp. E17]|uniref:YicC/YloC family endoribonuclease n=1 Tax=Haliea sp. E17 TaxID=3401576 RepID=UPI003AAD6C2A